MKKQDISTLTNAELKPMVDRIPFFKELKLNDYEQYQLLLGHSKLIILDQAEVLLNKGKTGKEIYFLASGRLDVFSEDKPGDMALNQLAPGEIIAALSIINDQPRTATLAASTSYAAGKTKVIATDFSIFGDLHDFTNIKLQTKINLIRLVINNIRFKLTTYQKKFPDHRLANKRHNIDRFKGETNSVEELESLAGQAFVLTHLLFNWNKETESSIVMPKVEGKLSTKDKILGLFSKAN